MLKRLKYHVEINNPHRVLEGDHEFKEGLTAITGPNGKGKSMKLEMVQYALFGTEALRGKADDYKSVNVDLTFDLNGRCFEIERTKSKAGLFELMTNEAGSTGKFALASGTKAVNAKILELFGYSADVFRVANLCLQGKVEQLGDMKPTARKQLVDETVGLNVLDDLVVFIDEQRKSLNSGISAIEKILVEPVLPEDPKLPQPSDFYKQTRDTLMNVRRNRDVVKAAAIRYVGEPTKVELHPEDEKLEQYQRMNHRRIEINAEMQALAKQFVAIPAAPTNMVDKLEEDDDKLEQYQYQIKVYDDYETESRLLCRQIHNPPCDWTRAQLAEQAELLRAWSKWSEKAALLDNAVPHDCPACNHHWEDVDPRIKDYEHVTEPESAPVLTLRMIEDFEATLAQIEREKPLKAREAEVCAEMQKINRVELVAACQRIVNTRKAYQASVVERQNAQRRTELEAQMRSLEAELQTTQDCTMLVQEILSARSKVEIYKMQFEQYQKDLKEKNDAIEKLETFSKTLDEDITRCDEKFVTALNYETNMANYQKAKAAYDTAFGELVKLKEEYEDWSRGRDAVADLRAKVKGYLLPSLNAVSSKLINEMTGGELSWIVVNDQFDIMVEGQRLETLSGAGKAVANLALRIALGQVLTNRVFSVMMLDEIDASCDEDRAKYIAACLKNLTKSIKQVIQVSHKQGLVADHYVRL